MPEQNPCEVYMRYLPRTCTEEELRAKFEKCGRITRVWLSVDRATGECKGFGFVTFSSKTEARRCVKDYNEHPRNYMDGKHVVITHAKGWDDGRKPVQACSFGLSCAREDCYFSHPEGWDPLNPAAAGDDGGDGDGGDGGGDGGGRIEGDVEDGGGGGGASWSRREGGGGDGEGRKRKANDGGGGGGGGVGGNRPERPFRKKKYKHGGVGAKARKRAKARVAKEAAAAAGGN